MNHRSLAREHAIVGLIAALGSFAVYLSLIDHAWHRENGLLALSFAATGGLFGLWGLIRAERWPVRILGVLAVAVAVFFWWVYFPGSRVPEVAGLELGAAAPQFTLNDTAGQPVSLSSLTAQGPALLVFYRGHW